MYAQSSGYIKSVQEFPIEEVHDPRMEKISRTQLLSEHATLSFLLTSIYHKLFNRFLKVEHSLGSGYYCADSEDIEITEENVEAMKKEMLDLLNSDIEIKKVRIPRSELVAFFIEQKFNDKLGLMKTWSEDYITCIQCGDYIDYALEPMSTDKERLKKFELRKYQNGLIIRFPTLLTPNDIPEWSDPKALFDMFKEYREWAKLINCDTVSKLNDIIYHRKINDLKWIAEGLHEQKFAKIAKHLIKNFPTKRIVTIAGPSSSNKTTFAMRLAIQLRVNGYDSIVIGMDDFYKDTCDIPYGADGLQDFESFSALNVEILGQIVHRILSGETVPARKFNFKTGKGYFDDKKTYTLPKNSFLIIEGIHGLNPELLMSLGADQVTPIYVSALTPLKLDYNHRFPTSDLRLIRRIIRDYRYRGYSPRRTIMRWTSVRVGEERNIFPFQGNAELFFNSALVYELPVLSVYGKALLAEATIPEKGEDPDSEQSQEITKEARRLLGLLNFFYPVETEIVPHISCIREFVGGSDLKY
ncbi:Phosphoribulokinase / Uridine kinase family protein [Histomonas meleagridis]|uniref:Phosphoribulokinase / Uridine kinase family protein n=1 Tax=Histomonas meleagridis TaxID=135588 RepID=UPI00355A82B5|nr:Phosphoribulokinase / Uridine kinase family protein [Histomonas meleagridis]KAH0797625.1 Phosphoribulokinase / Uridine kinase family protein [Histomonas meleagridis]